MLQGDEQALKALLSHYHSYLMVVGSRYLSDRYRVEDVIHDVFADLWNKQSETEISYGVKSFLRGAMVNKCLSILRKDKKMDYVEDFGVEPTDYTPSADQLMQRDQTKKVITDVVAALPEKCRQVFELSRYEGKSHKEISETLGVSKKTIENHMTRALKTLKTELKSRKIISVIILLIKSLFTLGVNP